MTRNLLKTTALIAASLFIYTVQAAFSGPVKIESIEARSDQILIYVSDPGAPDNPAGCVVGSSNPLSLNETGMEMLYSAALTAFAANQDVEIELSSGGCHGNPGNRVVIGLRIKH